MNNLPSLSRQLCALGSQYTLNAIPGVIPIVHSGAACCHRLYQGIAGANGYQGAAPWGGMSTINDNIHRKSLIVSAEKELEKLIAQTIAHLPDAQLLVVLSGCNVELVGDDIAAVIRKFQQQHSAILHVPSAGFAGSAYQGHEALCKVLIDHLATPGEVQTGTVNLFGITPYLDPFWRGNLHTITRLLALLDLQVNPLFGFDASIKNWQAVPNAQFNLLLSPWVDLGLVQWLEQRFATPFLQLPALPIGEQTADFLQQIATFCGKTQSGKMQTIMADQRHYQQWKACASGCYSRAGTNSPDHFTLIGTSQALLSYLPFLTNELGLVPGTQFLTDAPPAKLRKQITTLLDRHWAGLNIEWQPSFLQMSQRIAEEAELTPLLLLGSSEDAALIESRHATRLAISAPLTDQVILNRSHLGWHGALTLIEDIYSNMPSPPMSQPIP